MTWRGEPARKCEGLERWNCTPKEEFHFHRLKTSSTAINVRLRIPSINGSLAQGLYELLIFDGNDSRDLRLYGHGQMVSVRMVKRPTGHVLSRDRSKNVIWFSRCSFRHDRHTTLFVDLSRAARPSECLVTKYTHLTSRKPNGGKQKKRREKRKQDRVQATTYRATSQHIGPSGQPGEIIRTISSPFCATRTKRERNRFRGFRETLSVTNPNDSKWIGVFALFLRGRTERSQNNDARLRNNFAHLSW